MKKRTKILIMAIIAIVVVSSMAAIFVGCNRDNKIQIAVFAYKYDDSYITLVREAIKTKFDSHKDKVNVVFYNGENNQATQSSQIDAAITKGVDLLVINAVDFQAAGEDLAKKAKDANIPAVFFNREISDNAVKVSENICFVGTDPNKPGYMIGEMIAEMAKTQELFNKFDRNGDGKLNYVMLRAEVGNAEADGRTKFSVEEANRLLKQNLGIDNALQIVGTPQICNWSTTEAEQAMSSLLASKENEIDMVIANNDDMALGAIAALQTKGYNKPGSKTSGEKYIPVFGVDALQNAIKAIEDGTMQGTVKQDAEAMAEAIVKISLNIVDKKDMLADTNYSWDTGVKKLRIPYAKVQ